MRGASARALVFLLLVLRRLGGFEEHLLQVEVALDAPHDVVRDDLLVTQAIRQGVAALLVDGAIRDFEELQALGLPVWARWVRVRGAEKKTPGTIGEPVEVGGATIRQGDLVVLDADGVVVVEMERVDEVLAAAHDREERETEKRAKLQAGELSYDLDGLRKLVEG